MEIQFEEQKANGYFNLSRLTKKAQVAMESVVPDTKDDIGRILSVRPELYLKSKDWRERGATVSGEAVATVLYINENETAVSYVRMTQIFTLDYELPSSDGELQLQIRLFPGSVQARAINPRKLSADMEINGELLVSTAGEYCVSQQLPPDCCAPVHMRSTELKSVQVTSICEKSFFVNEQLLFPEELPPVREILTKEYRFQFNDKQNVGSRLLMKGQLRTKLLYLPEEGAWPCYHEFSIPLSQLVDLGTEDAEVCEVQIVPTSDYLALLDGVDGPQMLDLDLHVLAQVRAMKTQSLTLVSDAYSNKFPCTLQCVDRNVLEQRQIRRVFLRGEERVELPDAFEELLTVYAGLGVCTAGQGSINLDLLCRSRDGNLFAIRRSLKLIGADTDENLFISSFQINAVDTQIIDGYLEIGAVVEGDAVEEQSQQTRQVVTITLDEEKAYDSAFYPSLTAVWGKTESVWELAKYYHSSPESMIALNADLEAQPLFVPKSD